MKPATAIVGELIEDLALYPRHRVDDMHVADLVRAIKAGAALPPLIIEKRTKRIVDGFHRARAWRRVLGPEGEVPVEWRTFKNDAALFLESARLNATHGRRFDRHDQVRVIIRARELGADDESIAATLSVEPDRVLHLATRVVIGPGGESVPTKLGAHHMAGETVTKPQLDALRQMRGAQTLRTINELRALVEQRIVNFSDVRVREALSVLAALIQERLGEEAAA